MNEYKISKKTVDQLYKSVDHAISDARMKIYDILHQKDIDLCGRVDNILYELCISAPSDAVKIFEKNGK